MKKVKLYKALNRKNEEIMALQWEIITIMQANASLVRMKDYLMGLLDQGIEVMGEALADAKNISEASEN